ncbi:hypothetical protein [Undibacterium sp. TS12]|uniref:hypothetical protein n=1 Tax=Undibacterium sp. TS12 TaxID=2908202 RepID=UPI001F4CE925|nr:hypothetical protein [Undibacterium sp. TS12]MCH8622543.1 hypothetical protein [Undibacterium sp. TS12]
MQTHTLSTPATPNKTNEDLILTLAHNEHLLDVLIFDGASTVSEQHYLDAVLGDPAWFVQQFALALQQVVAPDVSQADSVVRALDVMRGQHAALLTATVPPYAWPIAALTWVRLRDADDTGHADGGVQVSVYALGDCKLFLLDEHGASSDLDPYVNPQEGILKTAIEQMKRDGLDEQARWAKLLPMLRDRRVSQNTSVQPSILCLHPQGPFAAREHSLSISLNTSKSARLVLMTDGFYRLVDSYHLYDDSGLLQACASQGLPALMQELRAHEAGKSGAGAVVKKTDDATVAMISF